MKLFIVHNTTLCVFHPKWGWRAAGLISAKDPEVTFAPWGEEEVGAEEEVGEEQEEEQQEQVLLCTLQLLCV